MFLLKVSFLHFTGFRKLVQLEFQILVYRSLNLLELSLAILRVIKYDYSVISSCGCKEYTKKNRPAKERLCAGSQVMMEGAVRWQKKRCNWKI